MQLYDGLSINNNKEELTIEVGDHARNVKLVKLKMAQAEEFTSGSQAFPPTSDDSDSDVEENTLRNNNQTNVQIKLVDLGGHTAIV